MKRDGSFPVDLLIPFDWEEKRYDEVVLAACTLGHLMGWQDGTYASAMHLLAELADMSPDVLSLLRRPDDERVMSAFLLHVQPAIAEDIRAGRVPTRPVVAAPVPSYDGPGEFNSAE